MSRAPELRTVAARGAAVALVRRQADLRGCDVGVFDADGAAIDAPASIARARPRVNGHELAADLPGACAAAPVKVFDRVAGFVVAQSRPGSGESHHDVATGSAAFLSELCSREYELNDLSREILGAYEELNLFYDLSAELAGAADAGAICRVVVAKAARVIGPDRAWVHVHDPVLGTLRPAASYGTPGCHGEGDGATVRATDGAAGRAFASRAPDLIEDVRSECAPLAGWELLAQKSLVTVPLHVPGREDRVPVGVLQLADRADEAPFTAGDLKLATALACHAAVLIENQRLIGYERELRIARTIQQSLLPAAPPRVAGLDIAGACLPASNVGGDYYDHVVTGPGTVGLVVADVSGHNIAAALLQTAARSTFRSEIFAGGSPGNVLARASRTLFDDLTRADLFLTAWYGTVDAATGRITVSDAGHNPALLYRAATGLVEELSGGGVPIGVLEDATYDEVSVVLEPGDIVLAYTDGIVEARRPGSEGDDYGESRLRACLAASAAGTAQAVVEAILADVALFDGGGAAADDRTLVAVKMRGPDSR